MKKIYTLAILMLTLLSCFVFSACGNKYKKLSLDFYSESGKISSVNLLLDEDNGFEDQTTVAVKFSGIKEKNIGEVVFEFPSTIGALSNQRRDGQYVYITLTVNNAVENESIYLKAIHVASGKSKSLRVDIDQKSNDVEILSSNYVISIPSAGTKTHMIDSKSIVNLLPAGSTDKLSFNIGDFRHNKIEMIKDGNFVTGFEISSDLTERVVIENVYPVTYLNEDIDAYKYVNKKFNIVFLPALSNSNLNVVSDELHTLGGTEKYLYEPIYLIANDLSKATDDYNYNNFYVQFQYKDSAIDNTKLISGYNYLDYYSIGLQDCNNISTALNDDKSKVFIQAKNMNENVEKIKIRFVPNGCVGDIETVEISVKIKADVKPEDIVIKQGEKAITDNNVNIYDVYTGNLDSHKISLIPEVGNSLSDLQNMRIQVPAAYLNAYVSETKGVNKIYETDEFYKTDEFKNLKDTSEIENLRKNDKLLTIYKNGEELNFYYDEDKGLISETITKNDKILVEYVMNIEGETSEQLSMKVFNYYSGNHEYLKGIKQVEKVINFNSNRGVDSISYEFGIAKFDGDGNRGYVKKLEGNPAEVYLDRNNSVETYSNGSITKSTNKYVLKITDVLGANNSIEAGVKDSISNTKFNIKLVGDDGQIKPIHVQSKKLVDGIYEYQQTAGDGNSEDYLYFTLDGLDIGKYTLLITHDSGFILKQDNQDKQDEGIDIFVYDSSVIDTTNLNITGNYIDNTANTYAGYGDYIVASGETLTIDVNHTVPSWYIKNYSFSYDLQGVDVEDEDAYYSFVSDGKTSTLKCLKGTYIDGIKKITLTSKVTYKKDQGDNLQLTGTNEKTIIKTIFVYEKIEEKDFAISSSEIDVYSYDLLGAYDKADSQLNLSITLPNNANLWNYIQSDSQDATAKIGINGDRDVVWFTNSINSEKVTTISQYERDITLQFTGYDSYDMIIHAKIKQFDKVFDHLSCIVHVRKPIITTSLGVKFEKTEDKKEVEIKDDILNIRDGVNYYMTVDNIANSSIITNKDSLAVVVNDDGEVETDIISLSQNENVWTISLKSGAELKNDLRLLVFAKDALQYRIHNNIVDLTTTNIINKYLKSGYSGAYKEYRLSLSNGTIENRYWIESADDFWEIKNNEKLKSKHFVLKNNINLKNTTYESGVIDNFSGSITTYNMVGKLTETEFKAGKYYEISGGKFVESDTEYDSTKTYYENKYYSIYGVELDTTKQNLFNELTGTISGINFAVKYNYDLEINNDIKLGIIGTNSGTLHNVTASVSGKAELKKSISTDIPYIAYFGVLVGDNTGSIIIDDDALVGVTGEINLSKNGKVYFGSLVGKNTGTIQGVIAEDSVDSDEFAVAFSDQGAISNLTTNSSLNHTDSTIGGVVGYNTGKLSNIYVTGKINAPETNNVGGVVGYNETTAKEAVVNYESSSYAGIDLVDNLSLYDLYDIKSSVVIQGKDNVGGIVGQDTGGNYYYCRYQIVADVTNHGIVANENVGGIAGNSTYGKFIYCSVYGYRWNFGQFSGTEITTFDDKNADIYGKNNVGGIIGKAYLNYSNTDNEPKAEITAIKQSSVNAYIQSENVAGGLVGVVENENATTGLLPVDIVYFMGKLEGTTINPSTGNTAKVMYVNYYYNYIDKNKDINHQTVDTPSGDNYYWKEDESINAGKPYILYNNGPIFDLAPNSVSIEAKDYTKTINDQNIKLVTMIDEKTVHIDYYQTKLSVLDALYESTQEEIDEKYNTYTLKDKNFFDLTSEPSGNYRYKVVSSNTSVVEILTNGKLKVKGVGTTVITFISVLNSDAKCSLTIEVNYPMNNSYAISNSSSSINDMSGESIATYQAKQYFVHELNTDFAYKTNQELGYKVNISVPENSLEEGKTIADYIKVSNNTYSADMLIAPGGKLSFELTRTINTTFTIKVTPYVYIGDDDQGKIFGDELSFVLSTKQGVSKIKLNYDNVVLYPNDEIYFTATFTTDKDLKEVANMNSYAKNDSPYLAVEYVENSLSDWNETTGIQTAKYKITVSDLAKNLPKAETVTITLRSDNVSSKAIFELRAQRIDNIDIKNYATTKTANPNEYKVDALSRVLRPSYNGLLVLDIVPSNGQFDYLEITDMTGSEEIIFSQIDYEGILNEGENISGEILNAERIEKGIRLEGKSSRYYVMTKIDKDYSSRIHTIKVTARSSSGRDIGTTYYYIDVKMMPSVTMKYFDPNGIEISASTDNDKKETEDININNKLYLANGVSGVDFYITTKNSDGNVDISLQLDSGVANEYFEMVKLQRDHYELNFKKYDDSLRGKILTITAQTRATMDNGTVEYESTTFKFIITDFVIHNISVNNSRRTSNYDYELYGDYNIPVELSFYFDETDISYYNSGNYHSKTYDYLSEDYANHINGTSITSKIYQILREINSNPKDYIKLNGQDWITAGNNISVSSDGVMLTRAEGETNVSLTVEKDNSSQLVLNLPYNYNSKEIDISVNKTLSLSRTYKFNFTNRTSLLKMQSINNEEEFLNMKSSASGYYILTKDLEFGKKESISDTDYKPYSPIDVDIAMFDGNGHTIRIYCFEEFAEETIQAGLFKNIEKNMIVMNLNVEYVSQDDGTGNWSFGRVTSGNTTYFDICKTDADMPIDYTSVLFGGITPTNNGIVTNCKVSGTIAMHASTLESKQNNTKDINFNIGGLVGINKGYITNSVSELQIYALANIGGLVYSNETSGKIVSSYFDAQDGKGLIHAYLEDVEIENAIEVKVAGFVVVNAGDISMSYTSIGLNSTKGNIGAMSVKDSSAGFVYDNSGSIKDCYVTEKILGRNNNTFHGFVFKNSGEIKTSYTYINEGGWNDKVRLFAPNGTSGLIDCVEFINTNVGYTVKSEGLNSIMIEKGNIKQYDKIENYKNFNFGDNVSGIWTIKTNSLPKLVSTLEKATGTKIVKDVTKTEIVDGKEVSVTYTEMSKNGYGTKQNPYIIHDLVTWNEYMKLDEESGFDEMRSYYRLVADIDFSSISKNLPTTELIFSGNIQGNNMSLTGFTIYSNEKLSSIGLFKEIKHSGAKEITPAIRNLTVEAYSVLAVKTEVVGVLAGYIENYHLYNVSVGCGDTVLGGNVVGGLAGVISGDLDLEDITSSVSVYATNYTIGGVYELYASKVNRVEEYQSISKVNFAGSVAGVVDAFDNTSFDLEDRNINSGYKIINRISVEGAISVIGENVGGIFGFLGERVKLTNANIVISGGNLSASRYAGMAVGENRGVIINVACSTTDENLFKDSNYIIGGVVGLNAGGYISHVNAEVDIIKETVGNTVAGIVGRNVSGTVHNADYKGKLFGYIIGGVIGVDSSTDAMNSSGTITDNSKNIIPESVNYGVNSFDNCSISIETFNYWLERMDKIYRYRIDTASGNLIITPIRCLGLFVARGEIDDVCITQVDDYIVFNGSGANQVVEYPKLYAEENGKTYEYKLSEITLFGNSGYIKYTINSGTQDTISIDGLKYTYILCIIGTKEDSLDAWSNTLNENVIYFINPDIIVKEEYVEPDPEAPVVTPPKPEVGNNYTNIISDNEILEKFKNAKPNNEAEKLEIKTKEELTLWMEYVGYNFITDIYYIDSSMSGSEINDINDFKECFDNSKFANYCYYCPASFDASSYYIFRFDSNKEEKTSKSTGLKTQLNYAFTLDNREDEKRTFPVDSIENYVDNIEDTDQLVYVLESGNKPICKTGSIAYLTYFKARVILADICIDTDSDLVKTQRIYEYLLNNVEYDYGALSAYGNNEKWETCRAWYAEGALIDGAAVCDGIAKAFLILCRIEGIEAIRVDSSNHAWNRVYIDPDGDGTKNWYVVDATHGNPAAGDIEINDYRHFLCTDAFKESLGQTTSDYPSYSATTEYNFYGNFLYDGTNDLLIESTIELETLITHVKNNKEKGTVTVEFVYIDAPNNIYNLIASYYGGTISYIDSEWSNSSDQRVYCVILS